MTSEMEMRNLMLHAAEKLATARKLTVQCDRTHGPRTLALPIEFYVATTYAETVLRMLAAYLKVEDAPAPARALERRKPPGRPDGPRNEHGQFVKESA